MVLYFRGPLSGTDRTDDRDARFQGASGNYLGYWLEPAVDVTGAGYRDEVIAARGIHRAPCTSCLGWVHDRTDVRHLRASFVVASLTANALYL